MDKRTIEKMIRIALHGARKEIGDNASRGGMYARGLSNEGYAGGYMQALSDILYMMNCDDLPNTRDYWSECKLPAKKSARAALPAEEAKPADCTCDPQCCPQNEGHGCACSKRPEGGA